MFLGDLGGGKSCVFVGCSANYPNVECVRILVVMAWCEGLGVKFRAESFRLLLSPLLIVSFSIRVRTSSFHLFKLVSIATKDEPSNL